MIIKQIAPLTAVFSSNIPVKSKPKSESKSGLS